MSKKAAKKAGAGHSVFYDLFPPDVAAEKTMRSELMIALSDWIQRKKLTQAAAAKVLGVSAPRVSDLVRQSSICSASTCLFASRCAPVCIRRWCWIKRPDCAACS